MSNKSLADIVNKISNSPFGKFCEFNFGLGGFFYSIFRNVKPDFPLPLYPTHFLRKVLHESLHVVGDLISGYGMGGPISFADNFYWLYSRNLEKILPGFIHSSLDLYHKFGAYAQLTDPNVPRTPAQTIITESFPFMLMPIIGSLIDEYSSKIKHDACRRIVKGFTYGVALDPLLNLSTRNQDLGLYKIIDNLEVNLQNMDIGEYYILSFAVCTGVYFLGRSIAKGIKKGLDNIMYQKSHCVQAQVSD